MAKTKNRHPKAKIPWGSVRLLALDVDGVLTDGTVLISSDGHEAKAFSILDGLGIRMLDRAGIPVAVISGRASVATTRRAQELGIGYVVQGRTDKDVVLQEIASRLGLASSACAYMGDDIIDLPAMAWAGIAIAPPGAMPQALAAADYVTTREAGRGAVREVCEHILAATAASRIEPRIATAKAARTRQPAANRPGGGAKGRAAGRRSR